MPEFMKCLPEGAREHFIDLRNRRLVVEVARYRARVSEFRAHIATNGHGHSGSHEVEEWSYREELFDGLAKGYAQDVLATCRLYNVPLTRPFCDCLVKAIEELLAIQYRNALYPHGHSKADVKIPLPVREQLARMLNGKRFEVMPEIRVAIETARAESVREKMAIAKKKESHSNGHNLTFAQNGSVMYAVQQLTIAELDTLREELAGMRAFFKTQAGLAETDECVRLLADAEKAADELEEEKMFACLRQVPHSAWETREMVLPQALLHYLKLRGMA